MSTYITEEEQIEQIKRWWQKHGNTLSTLLLVVVACFAGYRYWHWHQQKIALQASSLYEQMLVAYTNQDSEGISARANSLITNFPKSVYGDAAHLTLAKMAAEKKSFKTASEHLQKVIAADHNAAFTQIAKLRLARILLTQKQYQPALQAIDLVSNNSYLPLVSELRGDIYTAMGKYAEAKSAYDQALNTSREQKLGNLFLEMKTNDVARLKMSEQAAIKTA